MHKNFKILNKELFKVPIYNQKRSIFQNSYYTSFTQISFYKNVYIHKKKIVIKPIHSSLRDAQVLKCLK